MTRKILWAFRLAEASAGRYKGKRIRVVDANLLGEPAKGRLWISQQV